MVKKTLTLIVVLACCTSLVLAQDTLECATFDQSVPAPYGDPYALPAAPSIPPVVRLALHVVRKSDGSGGISSPNLDLALSRLKSAYVQANITFYVSSIDQINSDELYTFHSREEESELPSLFQTNNQANSINIYFIGVAYFNGVSPSSPSNACAVVNNDATDGHVLPHEIGHTLGLYHTFQSRWENGVEIEENILRQQIGNCIPNCDTEGDQLRDTPADPGPSNSPDGGISWHLDCTWVRILDPRDMCGNGSYSPDGTNFMSYAGQCRTSFSPLQVKRMHYYLSTEHINRLLPSYNITLSTPQFVEAGSGGSYKVNYVDVDASFNGTGSIIEGTPPQQYTFGFWSDANATKTRVLSANFNGYVKFKKTLGSNASTSNILSAHSLNNSLLGYPKHTAYHSAGEIWFTSRPSSGDSWSDDIRISSGDGGNNYPAMDTWSDEHYVAWQHQSGTLVQIMFSKFTSGQWASPQVIDNWTNPSAVNTLPAISGVFDRFWGIGQLQSIMVTYVRSGLTWWKISYNRGLTWSTFGPFSLLASKFEGTNFFGVSYVSSVNGSGISLYLDQLYGDGTLYQHIGWVPGCLISLSGEYLETRESYVSDIRFSYQDRTHISWWQYEFGDNEHYYVAAQSCNVGAQWSSVSAWEVGAPTSSTIATAFDNTVLMWSEGNQLKKVTASNVTGTWGSVASAGTGQYPILEYGFPHSDPSYLSIAAGSPISNIVQSTLSLQKTSNSTVDEVKREYSRVVFAVDTSTLQTFSIKMTQPRLNGRDIPFSAVNDTLPGINSENFFEFLRTKAGIIGSNDDTLTFKLSVTSKRMKGRQLSIPLSIEGISNSGNIGTLFSANESLCDSVTLLHVRVIVKNLAGMELSLKPLGRSLKDLGRNWVFGVGHVFDIPKNKKAEEDVTADIAVPAEAGIINNYPNPFNPSTEIRYQLPGPSFVTLKIYDVLGREVKALVNEELAAGYYTARFDGSGLSSGIYFARVSVTPREGKWAGTPLLYTLRMLLTK